MTTDFYRRTGQKMKCIKIGQSAQLNLFFCTKPLFLFRTFQYFCFFILFQSSLQNSKMKHNRISSNLILSPDFPPGQLLYIASYASFNRKIAIFHLINFYGTLLLQNNLHTTSGINLHCWQYCILGHLSHFFIEVGKL